MKTKSHASKARVSKIPPKSQSMLALAISEMVRATSTGDNPRTPPPTTSQRNPQNIINTPIMLEAPPSPNNNDVLVISHEGDPKAPMCDGKDCTLSIDECGGIDWFDGKLYCPLCSYKSAITEFEQLKKQVELAEEIARAQRNCMYAFVAGGICTSENAIAGGQEPVLVDTVQEPVLMDTGQEFERNNAESNEHVLVQVINVEEAEIGGKNDVSGEGACKQRNKSVVDSILLESSDKIGNNVKDDGENGNVNSGVDMGGKNDVSVTNMQCSSVLVESSDHNCDGGEKVSKERSDDNWDGSEEQVGRRSTNENNHDASVARVVNINPCELGKRPLGCDEASTSRKCDDNCDGHGEEVPKDRSDDNLDGGEENLGLPSQQVGRRSTDENDHDASVTRIGNTNPRELGKHPLGCNEKSTFKKCNDNCDGRGEEVPKDRSDDNLDGGEENLGLPSQQVGRRSTDENDHDASVAQVGTTDPRELGKRPLGCNEASSSRKCDDNCDGSGEEALKERSNDIWDGGEEDLGLPTQQAGRRRTDENDHDASVARVGNTNSRELRKRPLETSPGCDEASTSRKCNDNCDVGGGEATKERSDDNLDGDEVDLGLPTQQVGRRSTDENNRDASVARAGNANPRKRPLETSPGFDEVSTSGNSAKSSGLNRKRQRWTPEEVEMLMEAVDKSSAKGIKNTSWKCVLEYGRHVFNASRTSIDLRDKWRTVTRGPRAKQT